MNSNNRLKFWALNSATGRRMRKPYLILLAMLILTCVERNIENRIDEEESAAIFKYQIDSLVRDHINVNEPGLALLISYKGEKLVCKGYGLRDLVANVPITAKTNMRLASVSKQFTALCILTLVDRGLLSLDTSVYEIFPYLIFKNISVENLLNHTSGLPDYYDHFNSNWNRKKIVENKHVLNWLKTNPKFLFEPGSDYRYCNTGYIVLAEIVQKISGMEFSEYARKNVFEVVNMKEANYYNLAKPRTIKERAYCYQRDSIKKFVKMDGFFMNGIMGDGAVYCNIDDYYEYDKALRLKSKRLLNKMDFDVIFKPSVTYEYEGKPKHYALGWSVTDSTAAHTGGWLGVDTYTKRYLDFPLTIALFSNRTDVLFDSGLWKKIDSLAYVKARKEYH